MSNIENLISKNKHLDILKTAGEIGDSMKISEIQLPEGVAPAISDRDFVIATLVPPTVEIEPEKTEEEGEGEGETDEKLAEDKDLKKDGAPEAKQETSEEKTDKEKKKN